METFQGVANEKPPVKKCIIFKHDAVRWPLSRYNPSVLIIQILHLVIIMLIIQQKELHFYIWFDMLITQYIDLCNSKKILANEPFAPGNILLCG